MSSAEGVPSGGKTLESRKGSHVGMAKLASAESKVGHILLWHSMAISTCRRSGFAVNQIIRSCFSKLEAGSGAFLDPGAPTTPTAAML